MTIRERIANLFLGVKASEARKLTSYNIVNQAVPTPANYENFSKRGYSNNVIAYKCIHMIASACAGIEWEAYSKKEMGRGKPKELENHPLIELIEKPNPMQGGSKFIEAVVAFYLISGNTYIEAVKGFEKQPPNELWPVRPDRMKIIAGKDGYPLFYEFTVNGIKKRWPVDQIKFTSLIMHMKTFNPTNDWYGLSPLEAAMLSLDQSNSANKWNLSLLQNSATPSGVLQIHDTKANPRGEISEKQYGQLKSEFENAYQGAKNAGRPMILEGGLEWKQISMSPKDMDFLKAKEVSAIEIATVYGVPPELLGLGVKTYNNYKEARLAFYEDTVLPLMDNLRDELNRWLAPQFGDVELDYDKDDIEALVEKREAKYTSLQNVDWLTMNEKRQLTGQDEAEGGDIYVVGGVAVESLSDLIAEDEPVDQVDENGDPIPPVDPNNPAEIPDSNQDPTDKVPDSNQKPPTEKPDPKEKGWKSFNLVNGSDRKQNYRRQNARRKSLEAAFKKDLEHAFKEMNENIVKAAKDTDIRISEYAMLHELSDSIVIIKSVMKKHIKLTLNEFGYMIFHEAKETGLVLETKANTRKFDDYVSRYVEKRTGEAITHIEGTTKKKIHQVVKRLVNESIQEGEPNANLAGELMGEFEALTASRSTLIARTEVASASNNGSLEAVKSLDIPGMYKEWNSIQDDRTRDGDTGNEPDHLGMNGERVAIEEKFTVPPDADMECPGDPSAGADQICNCRCTLTYGLTKPGDEG